MTNDNITDYLFRLAEEGKSALTLNIAINALKSYFGEILKRSFVYEETKDKKLPVVLSQEEISRILSHVSNIKHKTILMLISYILLV